MDKFVTEFSSAWYDSAELLFSPQRWNGIYQTIKCCKGHLQVIKSLKLRVATEVSVSVK